MNRGLRSKRKQARAPHRDPKASLLRHLERAREAGDEELVSELEELGREAGYLPKRTAGEELNAEIRAKWRGDGASELERRLSGNDGEAG